MLSVSSPTSDQTGIIKWILNHWTTREVPKPSVFKSSHFLIGAFDCLSL